MRRFNKKDVESSGFETVFRVCDSDALDSRDEETYGECLWTELDRAEMTVDIPEVVELEPEVPEAEPETEEPPKKERPKKAGAQTILTPFILILISMFI